MRALGGLNESPTHFLSTPMSNRILLCSFRARISNLGILTGGIFELPGEQ